MEIPEKDLERGKNNLLKMLEHSREVEKLSDGELIDEFLTRLDKICKIGDYDEALFTEVLERFQKSIGLEITPLGFIAGMFDLFDSEDEWQEEFTDDRQSI